MKTFMVLHYGFIMPTPEDMEKWNTWFESISDIKIDQGHFPMGKEIDKSGTSDLPFSRESITGFTMFKSEDLETATKIAEQCPFVDSTRIYEIKS